MNKTLAKVDHTARAHSRISPSGLKSIQLCPGYESDNRESAAATRGTRLHEIMDTGHVPSDLPDEDREIATQVLEVLRDTESQSKFEPLKEIKVDYSPLNLRDFEQGHVDRVIVLETNDSDDPTFVELIDFKFGKWAVDHVSENIQFRAYALGLFILFPSIDRIRVRLIQPALNKDETHTFNRKRDYDMIVSQIGAIVRRRHKWLETRDETMLRANETNCAFCAMQATCPVWQKYMVKLANDADLFGHEIVPISKFESPETADPDDVLRAFRWVKPMEDYLKKFKRFALAVYDTGKIESGMTMIEKPGDTTIVDPIRVAEILRDDHGVTFEEFLSICDVSVTKLKSLVGSRAKTGEKGRTQEEAVRKLVSEGLIQHGPLIRYVQLARGKNT
jgi:hypothetical protein